MRKIMLYLGAMLILVASLTACKGKSKQVEPVAERITIKYTNVSTPLYFTGFIDPIRTTSVNSPVDGIIGKQYFNYGEIIKPKQKLFDVVSEKMATDFLSAVEAYLKARDDYNSKQRQFEGSEELWKLQFISANDYYTDKTASEESYFSLQQAIANVVAQVRKAGITADLKNINLANPAVMRKIIQTRRNLLPIYASVGGIALYPIKSAGSGSDNKDAVNVGSDVKQDQLLLSLGDLNGLSIAVQVSEVDVNLIKLRQPATVTGPAFANIQLSGYVSAVNQQAVNSSSSLPTFPVTITVDKLTPAQQSIIHVGMSATVQIDVETKNTIMIPIAAVYLQGNQAMVKVEDPKTKAIKEVPVKTGKSSLDAMEITQGLKPGDVVVYYH